MKSSTEPLTTDQTVMHKAATVLPELSRLALIRLRTEGRLSASALDKALVFCGFRPDAAAWRLYVQHMLLIGGALFLVAGVIFFIASNWSDMHHFTRMALVGAVVVGTGLGAVWRGPDTPVGKALLLSCGISVGPLLAVFGQTYLTGSELWELFRVWTVILFALALAGRQAALWFVTWLSANVFVILWLGLAIDSPLMAFGMFGMPPEYVLGLALAIVAWELSARIARQNDSTGQHAWLQARWLPRLMFFDLIVRLTTCLSFRLLDSYMASSQVFFILPPELMPVLALAVAGASWFWYRIKAPELFMLTCLVFAGEVLIVAALLGERFLFSAEVSGFLLWGLMLVGLTAVAASILLALQRSMTKSVEKDDKQYPGPTATPFFAPARPLPDWRVLWGHLKAHALLPDDAPLPKAQSVALLPPWYVRAILALGGWVAALVLLIFLGLFSFTTMKVNNNQGGTLFMASLVPLALSLILLQNTKFFFHNLGFSLALTGTAGACIGLAIKLEDVALVYSYSLTATSLSCAALIVCLCFVMPSTYYRFLAALCIVQLVAFGISIPGFDSHFWNLTMLKPHGYSLYAETLWWAAICCGLAVFSLRESAWRGLPRARDAKAILSGAYGGTMVYLISLLGYRSNWWSTDETTYGPVMSGQAAVGLGAASGLVCLVYGLVNGQVKSKGSSRGYALVAGCAALSLPLGWFLPGAALAAFGLALSRYLGSLVMQGATCAFLLVYMVYYYYFLGISLLYKSLFMAATGTALLALAFCLNRFKGDSHA